MAVFNLYEKNEALGFDHVHRRGDSSSKAIQEHPRQMVKRVYEEFTNNILDSMREKVEIVYGQKVQGRLLRTHKFEASRIWSKHSDSEPISAI